MAPDRRIAGFSTQLNSWLENLSNTRRGRKQVLGMMADAGLSVCALWLAYSLRHGEPFSDLAATWYLFVALPAITVVLFMALGIYRWVVRSSNRRMFLQLGKGCVLSALTLVLFTYLLPPDRSNPRSLFVIYGLLLMAGSSGFRVVWQGLFYQGSHGEPVAIYGAGSAGQQLVGMMHSDANYRPVVFLDDNPNLQGTTVAGIPVLNPARGDLGDALRKREIARIVLAMPSLGTTAYRERVEAMEATGLALQTIPQLSELIAGRVTPADIRDVSIKDILGRSEVPPDNRLLGRCVRGRSVLVTGGGGSIGSELCRQILLQRPDKLIVLDNGEANLYHVTESLTDLAARHRLDASIFLPVLGSVTQKNRLKSLMREHRIDTVYHAAAYKHVPIVEAYPEEGVKVNIFGTLNVLEAAIAFGVEHFVLISTDKAVRPTNAMGASKRVAELVLQAKAAEPNMRTRISMVRFGNVLGSSGSVVPKFSAQIKAGGPITITHPDITRYFMTIPEATQLVLQASAIAKGGEVFVLDMGEPVKIVDLAKTMVKLFGKQLHENMQDNTGIAIKFTGLRPGEKMYEELFVTDSHQPTEVTKLFTANEASLEWSELTTVLHRIEQLSSEYRREEIRLLLFRTAFLEEGTQITVAPFKPEGAEPQTLASQCKGLGVNSLLVEDSS